MAVVLLDTGGAGSRAPQHTMRTHPPRPCPPTTTHNACPTHPKTLCDFYFDGYEHIVPTFYLDDGVIGDHALVPRARSTLSWVGDMQPALRLA